MLNNTLNLIPQIRMTLEAAGYTKPTAIQEKAIPKVLEGHDLLGVAQTGTGKTAAFALPILQTLYNKPKPASKKRPIRALVIAPTRELAIQIGDSFNKYGKNLNLRSLVVYGGVSQHPQTKRLRQGVDIVIATPGRLLDLTYQKHIDLKNIDFFVLDEADMMLDMGMIDDVKKIIKFLPQKRQTMLFSATMPRAIEQLTQTLLHNPVKVEVTPTSSTVDTIKQEVYFVDRGNKTNLLIELLKDKSLESVLVFSRTKRGANKIVSALINNGFKAAAIHGDKTQRARQIALRDFKERKVRVLVATDIAARGIDINELSHVINYNLPEVPETYVHRIGRTGRSGNEGIAISFCAHEEKSMLHGIQKLTQTLLTEVVDHPFPLKDTSTKPSKGGRGGGRGGRSKKSSGRNRNSNQGGKKNRNNRRRRPSNQK